MFGENVYIYTLTPTLSLFKIVFTFFLEKHNLFYLTVISKILFDIVVHIKMMFWTCLF